MMIIWLFAIFHDFSVALNMFVLDAIYFGSNLSRTNTRKKTAGKLYEY